jgi:hypothetical protein
MDTTMLDQLYVDMHDGTIRNISPTVLVGQLRLPDFTEAQHTELVDKVLEENTLFDPGDVLSTKVPPSEDLAAILANGAVEFGIEDVPSHFGARLLACLGSWFHHDTAQDEYRRAAFSVLWLEDESPWDLLFPLTGHRVPLTKGTHVLFDSCNIHGVVKRGTDRFVEADFYSAGFQMFFSTEHQYASPILRKVMGVDYLPAASLQDQRSIQSVRLDSRTGKVTL